MTTTTEAVDGAGPLRELPDRAEVQLRLEGDRVDARDLELRERGDVVDVVQGAPGVDVASSDAGVDGVKSAICRNFGAYSPVEAGPGDVHPTVSSGGTGLD